MKQEQQWIINSINDADITASSEFNNKHAAKLARLNFRDGEANWSAKKCNNEQWIQVDLKTIDTVCEVAVQGRFNKQQWVTKYNLLLSKDLANWKTFENIIGVSDNDTVSFFKLPKPTDCRYIRFVPTEWHGHISMRIDVAIAKNIKQGFVTDLSQKTNQSESEKAKIEIEKLKLEIEKKKLELELSKLTSEINSTTNYDNEAIFKTEDFLDANDIEDSSILINEGEVDELIIDAIALFYVNNDVNRSLLVKELQIGYNRASEIISTLIENFEFYTTPDDKILMPSPEIIINKFEQLNIDYSALLPLMSSKSSERKIDEDYGNDQINSEKYNQSLMQEEEEQKRKLEEEEEEEEVRKRELKLAEQEERDREAKAKQDMKNAMIGSHEFKSSLTRGGDAIFPEHICVDDNEVTWKKKTGLFSKESKTIPIKNITQIDIETSLIGAKIKIRSKGFGFIQGENFTKSDVKEIKRLIEKVQGNL